MLGEGDDGGYLAKVSVMKSPITLEDFNVLTSM